MGRPEFTLGALGVDAIGSLENLDRAELSASNLAGLCIPGQRLWCRAPRALVLRASHPLEV